MELLTRLLPHVLREDKTFFETAEILSPKVMEVMEEASRLFLLGRIDTMDEKLLSHLAYQFHVDFYDESLSLEKKRALVKGSIRYHRKKGTPRAVEEFLSEVFSTSSLSEWFEYGGEPYFFKVKTRDRLSDEEAFSRFFRALYVVKNTRSWLESFLLDREESHQVFSGGVDFSLKSWTYLPYGGGEHVFSLGLFSLGMGSEVRKVTKGISLPREVVSYEGGETCAGVRQEKRTVGLRKASPWKTPPRVYLVHGYDDHGKREIPFLLGDLRLAMLPSSSQKLSDVLFIAEEDFDSGKCATIGMPKSLHTEIAGLKRTPMLFVAMVSYPFSPLLLDAERRGKLHDFLYSLPGAMWVEVSPKVVESDVPYIFPPEVGDEEVLVHGGRNFWSRIEVCVFERGHTRTYMHRAEGRGSMGHLSGLMGPRGPEYMELGAPLSRGARLRLRVYEQGGDGEVLTGEVETTVEKGD